MAGTIMTAMFWVTKKFRERQFHVSSIQTEELKMDASTEVYKAQTCEKSTQTMEIKNDVCSQVEELQVDTKSTQTAGDIMHEKAVQTFTETSDDKGIQTSPCSFLDQITQTKIISNSCQVLKSQNKRSKIPRTTEFQKYLERKKVLHKEEELSIGTKFQDQLEIQVENVDRDFNTGNSSNACLSQSREVYIHYLEDNVVATYEPVSFPHECTPRYKKLSEEKENQNRLSRFKKKFEKFKKLFKK